MLFGLSRPMREKKGEHNKSNDKIKLMMVYIHEHYGEKISIPELAAAAYLSERECYRVFHGCLQLVLEIPNPTDDMDIVSYYAGDC